MGYWPIVHGKKWRAKKYDLTDLLIYAGTTRAMQMFLTIYVAEDQRNVSRRLIYMLGFEDAIDVFKRREFDSIQSASVQNL
ncbi:unnamed protein product [Anisakis simplex]|uniref:Helitron_like_N domain-containing protein n=1 Tax=Anisakis simplex TaxID=6269 RepID=A0A0M3JJ01_ANISI|nr:unnamed protein product [Anisakis simplex]